MKCVQPALSRGQPGTFRRPSVIVLCNLEYELEGMRGRRWLSIEAIKAFCSCILDIHDVRDETPVIFWTVAEFLQWFKEFNLRV